jgi:hypothetical protein
MSSSPSYKEIYVTWRGREKYLPSCCILESEGYSVGYG